MKDDYIYRQSGSKESIQEHNTYCIENKIPARYYRQRNAILVDFTQIDEFVRDYPAKITSRDLDKIRTETSVDSNILEELYYRETIKKIIRKLPPESKKIFKLMVEEYNQTEIAKRLKITARTVRRHVQKIRKIVTKILNRVS